VIVFRYDDKLYVVDLSPVPSPPGPEGLPGQLEHVLHAVILSINELRVVIWRSGDARQARTCRRGSSAALA
jgi:hypothetical protein